MFGINKKSLDEETLKKEAQDQLKDFLERQKQSLATFTREPGLRYIGSADLEKFSFKPKEGALYLPLATFLEEDLDDYEILWHIYYELALYPDWKENPRAYLDRKTTWKAEIDEMTYLLSKKVRELLDEKEKIEAKFIRQYVEKEVLDFLFQMDKYAAFLRVLETCPLYRDQEEKGKIIDYMKENKDPEEIFSSLAHQGFAKSFLLWTLYQDDPQLENALQEKFPREILGQSIYTFLKKELVKEINQDQGIEKRDPLVRAFIYPSFKKYWLEEIESMGARTGDGDGGEKFFEESQRERSENKLESTRKDVEESLEDLLQQELTPLSSQEDQEAKSMKAHGLSQEDIQQFHFYARKTKAQREEMRAFWKQLLGSARKEINVEKNHQAKGKLNVHDLIDSYPDFIEAEEKGNYKDLKIFNKNYLESKNKQLPEKIEISFLIDNSGSMNQEKIEATRKTLAVALLSIQDFNQYLQAQGRKTKQKIEVLTETWFFGQDHYKVKDFEDKKDLEKAKIIASLVKQDGGDGTTDDAACLRDIYKNIGPSQKQRIRAKKEYKILFEITDGASSFPGSSKEIVKKLMEENVEIYAIQIGKISQLDTKTFNYIWNDSFKYPRGMLLGEDIQKLPEELLKMVKQNLGSIFHN